jgi:hypothetical protein
LRFIICYENFKICALNNLENCNITVCYSDWNLIDKRFTSIEPEIGVRRVATSKDNDKLQKFGLYLNMYKEKWKRAVMKYDEE